MRLRNQSLANTCHDEPWGDEAKLRQSGLICRLTAMFNNLNFVTRCIAQGRDNAASSLLFRLAGEGDAVGAHLCIHASNVLDAK
jgi:hypothetical protein